VRMVWQTLKLSDAVGGISLGGSRAKDYATRLSDWDLYLNGEPARLMAELPGLQVRVPEDLGRQVLAALREHQLVSRA
jgi:predicted nucleotidyltransferase